MKKKINLTLLVATAVFGLVFGIATNIFIDSLMENLWRPLVVALLFTVFAVLLCIVITVFKRDKDNISDKKTIVLHMLIISVALFASTMLFEFLYEIEPNKDIKEATSYIFLIDDSGSMQESDPQNRRATTLQNLIDKKSGDFSYAVYSFSNDVKKCRDMMPKSYGNTLLTLKSEGGTALFTALKTVIADINSGALKLDSETKVLLLSDGYAGDTPFFKGSLLKKFNKRNITVSTIGLGNGVDEHTMQQIAEYTGGVYVHADNASMLEDAMTEAATASKSYRHLLGYRGFCSTNTLHAIMRTVFLLIIIALIQMLKIYACGKVYTPNLILCIVTGIVTVLMPEIALENINLDDGAVRIAFWTLLALCISVIQLKTYGSRRNDYQDPDEDYPPDIPLGGSSELDKSIDPFSGKTNSLG